MGGLARFFLAATAFAPIFLVYAIVSAFDHEYCHVLAFFSICAFLTGTCLLLIKLTKSHMSEDNFETRTVETADGENLSLILVYLLPLITNELNLYYWTEWAVIAVFICLIVSRSYGYHFNPLLSMFGYHFYKVAGKEGIPHILINRRRIYNKGENLKVIEISGYTLIETEVVQSVSRLS